MGYGNHMVPLLSGVKVVEMTSVVMGPFAGQILADLGAEVIKIEPLSGDIARDADPAPVSGMGAMYVNNNRNKKTIALDAKASAGFEVARRLVVRANVFLHNMRIEAIERLGFGFEAVCKMNPKIIYCSAIGFGQAGRYRDLPAYDDVIQAASGLVGLTQTFGQDPQLLPTILADKVGALYSVYGVLAALVHRANGGDRAIKVEMSMFEALASFVLNEHLSGATFANEGSTGYHRILSPNRKPHRTKDGWIVVLPYTSENWRALIAELGRADIMNQEWFADRVERAKRANYLYGEIAPAMVQKSTAEWLEILNRLDVPCSRVNSLDDLLEDEHLADVGFFKPQGDFPSYIARSLPQPVVFSGIEPTADKPAPVHGSDTREILRTCGYADADIDTMIKAGVVATGGDRTVRVA